MLSGDQASLAVIRRGTTQLTPRPTDLSDMLIKGPDEKVSSNDFGFPPGYFILRSVSTRRLLDIASDSVQDSAPIILWPEKDNSLVESKS